MVHLLHQTSSHIQRREEVGRVARWHGRQKQKGEMTDLVWGLRERQCRSRGIFCLSSFRRLFEKVRTERVHLALHCTPGYFKKTPRCSTRMHTQTSYSTPLHTHINRMMGAVNITHLTWESHCTWHIPPILVCSHITLATAAVVWSHIICCFLHCCHIKCCTLLKPLSQMPKYLCETQGPDKDNVSTPLCGWL